MDATLKNGIIIRLTDERWSHIAEQYGELSDMQAAVLQTVELPERILEGGAGELMAVREIEAGKWLVVVYRETSDDGFIITLRHYGVSHTPHPLPEQEDTTMALAQPQDYLKFLPMV